MPDSISNLYLIGYNSSTMKGGEIIRQARKRARLTQQQLASLLGTSQAVIARWERGRQSPSFDRVLEAVRACGLDLALRIVERDDEHALLIDEALRLTPTQRVDVLTRSRKAIEELVSAAKKVG